MVMDSLGFYGTLSRSLREDRNNPQRPMRRALLEDVLGDKFTFRSGMVDMHRLFEACVGRPLEYMPDHGGMRRVLETEGAVGLDDFRIITSQLVFRDLQDRPKNPQFISDRLCRVEKPVGFTFNETIPWFPAPTRTGSTAKPEGKPYKEIGATGAFIQITPPETFGAIIKITKKLLMGDRSGGGVLRMCRNAIEGEEIDRERRRLAVILGTDSTAKWRFGIADRLPSTEYTPYNSSGGKYVNVNTGGSALPFDSWKTFNTMMDTFRVMVDPITGERLSPPTRMQVVAPQTLAPFIDQQLRATSVQSVDNRANNVTVRVDGPNPITYMQNGMGVQIEVLTSPWVDEIINNGTTWYAGNFQDAVIDLETWPPTYDELANGGEQGFYADIIHAMKVSMDHKTNWYNPFLVTKNVAT